MISVITWCYSRQEMLNITLPKWTTQKGVDYELVVGIGPNICVPPLGATNVQIIDTPDKLFCNSYNKLVSHAKGDTLLITQCDMEVNSDTQLKRMYELCNDRTMVTEKFFKDGKRDNGIYAQFLMVKKQSYTKVGGFCELYDNPESGAHEDSDLVASLLELGIDIKMISTPKEEGVYHIDHPRPDYINDKVMLKRLAKGREIFNSRHKMGIMALYAKQIMRNSGRHCVV